MRPAFFVSVGNLWGQQDFEWEKLLKCFQETLICARLGETDRPRRAPGYSVVVVVIVVVVVVVVVDVAVSRAAGAEIIFSKEHFQYNEGSPTTSIPQKSRRWKEKPKWGCVGRKNKETAETEVCSKSGERFLCCRRLQPKPKKFESSDLGQDTFSERLRRFGWDPFHFHATAAAPFRCSLDDVDDTKNDAQVGLSVAGTLGGLGRLKGQCTDHLWGRLESCPLFAGRRTTQGSSKDQQVKKYRTFLNPFTKLSCCENLKTSLRWTEHYIFLSEASLHIIGKVFLQS